MIIIKKLVIDKANRQHQMPPDILAFAKADGESLFLKRPDTIDLAGFVWPVTACEPSALTPDCLRPATTADLSALKEELAGWLSARCSDRIVPDKELYIGGSISTLIFQLALAYIDVGDVAFVPSLGVPLYRRAVHMANGEPLTYNISAKSDWRPQFDRLNTRLGKVARLLFVNSPHNPTGAELSEKDFAELAWLAGRENILIVNDAAYAGLPARTPASLLAVKGGRRVGLELHSFSYLLGLPRLPFGFAVGNRDAINGLKSVARLAAEIVPKLYVDLALDGLRGFPGESLRAGRSTVQSNRANAEKLLAQLRVEAVGQETVPYLWARIDKRTLSVNLARRIFNRHRVLVVPGSAFGECGEGHLRLSLLAPPGQYAEAAERTRRRILRRKGEA